MLVRIGSSLVINMARVEYIDLNATKDGQEGYARLMFGGRKTYTWLSPPKASALREAIDNFAATLEEPPIKHQTVPPAPPAIQPWPSPAPANGHDPSEAGLSKAQITAKRQIEAIMQSIPKTDLPQMSIATRTSFFNAIKDWGWNAPEANAPLIVRSLIGKYKRDIAHISEVEGAAIAQWLPTASVGLIDAIFPPKEVSA